MIKRRGVRKLGYIADQQGIINRYLREKGGWDSHLMRTRDFILEGVKAAEPDTVTILGSGWLLDVPLEELTSICGKINLVDINHPAQVRRKAGGFKNVSLIEDDITGGVTGMIRNTIRKDISPAATDIPLYEPDYNRGFVVSVNLLTQLDMIPADYMAARSNSSSEELREFRKKIQESHIKFLREQTSLLISDYQEEIWRDDDRVEVNDLLFTSFPEGEMEREWMWDFDTGGSYYRRSRVLFKVRAVLLRE
ncbi:MAG: hypothetical protein LC649_06120 [Bacteroidales bacterium]|nr:hypothetical protein [Bacteroidales bacterium]